MWEENLADKWTTDFYGPYFLLIIQTTASKHWRKLTDWPCPFL